MGDTMAHDKLVCLKKGANTGNNLCGICDVPFGETSPVHELRLARRGTMYVYNSETFEEIFTLPIDLGPLGNSYSLIIVGSKEQGYEAIVLQEF